MVLPKSLWLRRLRHMGRPRKILILLVAMLGCEPNESHASSQRKPFHRPSCEWAEKINAANLQIYDTREDAIAAGHRACKVCAP